MSMIQLFVGPIIANIINTCMDYLKNQLFGQTSMKEALERLQTRLPIIISVVSAYYQAQIIGQNPALDRWIWQLRDAIDEADDLLDEFEYLKHKKDISKNTEEIENFLSESAREIFKFGERALKSDPNVKRLEEVVQNLDEISAELRELPDLPPSLNTLKINNCHPEFMERYKKISGSDWHKIAHIPNVDISNRSMFDD